MDSSPEYIATHGKRYLTGKPGELETNITLKLIESFKKQHPEFIGHKRIFQASRMDNKEHLMAAIERAKTLHRSNLVSLSKLKFPIQ